MRRMLQEMASGLLFVFSQERRVYLVLASYFAVGVVYCTAKEIYGPFLRTLVQCDTPAAPGASFSGSAFCGDVDYVLQEALKQEGTLVSAKLFLHGLAAPFLGSLTDRLGRKAMLLCSFVGFSVPMVCFLLISVTGVHSYGVLLLCFLVAGATNAFDVVYHSILADLTPDMKDRSAAFTTYAYANQWSAALAQFIAVGILKLELRSYTVVWIGFLAVLFLDFVFVQTFVPETLQRTPEGPAADKGLFRSVFEVMMAPLTVVASDSFMRWWILSDAIETIGNAGLKPIIATFTLSAYGWKQGDAQLYTWFIGPLSWGFSLASPALIKFISPAVAVLLRCFLDQACGVVRIFSPLSPVFFLAPGMVGTFGSLLVAPSVGFQSSMISSERQATMHSVGHLVGSVGTSISTMLYTSPLLYRSKATGLAAMRPFIFGCAASAVGFAIKFGFTWPFLRRALRGSFRGGRGPEEQELKNKGDEFGWHEV